MIKEKKITKINEALSEWHEASAEFLDFRDSMSNVLVLGLFKDGKQTSLRLGACQHVKSRVYLKNVALYSEQIVFEGHDCFLLKDANSDLEIVVSSAIQVGEVTVTVGD